MGASGGGMEPAAALFQLMTENVSDLIVLMDHQGHRVWNNPAYSHLMGYSQEELSGRTPSRRFIPTTKRGRRKPWV